MDWRRGPAGSCYVSLAQPASPLLGVALEPDPQNSCAANPLLEIADDRLLRVMAAPAVTLLQAWPAQRAPTTGR